MSLTDLLLLALSPRLFVLSTFTKEPQAEAIWSNPAEAQRPCTATPSFLMVSTPRKQNQLPSKSPEQQFVRQPQQNLPNRHKRWNLKTRKRHLEHQEIIFSITGWQPAQYTLSKTQCRISNLSLSRSETSEASHKFHLRGSKGMALLTKHGKRPNSNLVKCVPLS